MSHPNTQTGMWLCIIDWRIQCLSAKEKLCIIRAKRSQIHFILNSYWLTVTLKSAEFACKSMCLFLDSVDVGTMHQLEGLHEKVLPWGGLVLDLMMAVRKSSLWTAVSSAEQVIICDCLHTLWAKCCINMYTFFMPGWREEALYKNLFQHFPWERWHATNKSIN